MNLSFVIKEESFVITSTDNPKDLKFSSTFRTIPFLVSVFNSLKMGTGASELNLVQEP